MQERCNLEEDIRVLSEYFSEGAMRDPARAALRVQSFQQSLRQMQVVDLYVPLIDGLHKLGLAALLTDRHDAMPAELEKLKKEFESAVGEVLLNEPRPEHASITILRRMGEKQLDALRHCGSFADFKKWNLDMKFVDPADQAAATTKFNKMYNHVTALLQVWSDLIL